MRYFKRFEYGMWRVHAFEADSSADPYITDDMHLITKEEAEQLAKLPPSDEFKKMQEEGIAALGGRGISRYPTKEVKEAIGHICVNSAHFEVTLRIIIWHVAGISTEVGMTLTGGKLSLPDLIETLKTLLELRYPLLAASAKGTLSKVQKLNDERGRYVHGIWHPGKEGQITVGKAFLKRTHAQGEGKVVLLDELYEVAEGYMKAESELLEKILQPLISNGNLL